MVEELCKVTRVHAKLRVLFQDCKELTQTTKGAKCSLDGLVNRPNSFWFDSRAVDRGLFDLEKVLQL